MSELTFTLLRLGYLVLLWVFVLSAVAVLRRDLAGPRTAGSRRRRPELAGPAPSPAPGGGAPRAPQRGGPSRLVVVAGPLTGTTIPLTSSGVLIGRAPSCTLVLDDDYSSSRHARLYPEAGQWFVEDLGSTNGTFLGSARVDAPMPVTPGAPVKVGKSVLELQ